MTKRHCDKTLFGKSSITKEEAMQFIIEPAWLFSLGDYRLFDMIPNLRSLLRGFFYEQKS